MEQVLVNKVKFNKFINSAKVLKRKYAISRILIIALIIVAGTQQYFLHQPQERPIFMGTGTLEKISDNVYQIKDDADISEIDLPPMPAIAK